MRLFCKCGSQLMMKHEIVLEVISNFTSIDGLITLTKHHLLKTSGIKPSIKEEKVKEIFCRECNKPVDIEDSYIHCDNCGSRVRREEAQKYGDTIILCPRCVGSCKNYEVYKIFGNRGPSAQARESRINEAINDAVEARPEMPDEVLEMLRAEMQETEASNPDRPFDVEDSVVATVNIPASELQDLSDRWSSAGTFTFNSTSTGRINTGDT